jgi:hypothetical protein
MRNDEFKAVDELAAATIRNSTPHSSFHIPHSGWVRLTDQLVRVNFPSLAGR